jgi:hypothetical protein
MRVLFIATIIFIFNTAFMPLLGIAHEYSHDDHDGKARITWSDEQSSNGLFQVAYDNHQDQTDSTAGIDPLDHHQCHHASVIGMPILLYQQTSSCLSIFNTIEPLFSIESFPSLIDYPPKNT